MLTLKWYYYGICGHIFGNPDFFHDIPLIASLNKNQLFFVKCFVIVSNTTAGGITVQTHPHIFGSVHILENFGMGSAILSQKYLPSLTITLINFLYICLIVKLDT